MEMLWLSILIAMMCKRLHYVSSDFPLGRVPQILVSGIWVASFNRLSNAVFLFLRFRRCMNTYPTADAKITPNNKKPQRANSLSTLPLPNARASIHDGVNESALNPRNVPAAGIDIGVAENRIPYN